MALNNLTYLKTNWISILAILLFIWIMFKPSGCGPKLPWEKATRDTITTVQMIPQQPVIIPTYQPQQTGSTTYPIVIPPNYQGSQNYEILIKQYNDLAKEFLATRNYKDSISLRDDSGRRVGVVNLNDVVSENKIQSRSPDYKLIIPHTTTTITIREPYKPKNQLFVGGGLTGNTTIPLNGVNLGLLYKTKKDKIFNATVGVQSYNSQIVPQFSLNSYWKIHLGK